MNNLTKITAKGIDFKVGNPTKVTWDANSNMNNFKTPGVYEIYGERTKQDDNLPINNASSGHSFSARLTVLASTLQPANNEICITQFLMLSNRQGGDGNMYYRTYNQNNSPFTDGWSVWQKVTGCQEGYIFTDTWKMNQDGGLQTRNVGLNYMVDNGTYSGVYVNSEAIQIDYDKPWNEEVSNGSGKFTTNIADIKFIETFNITTINDYAVAGVVNNLLGAMGQPSLERQICQVKIATDVVSGTSSIKKRVYKGNDADYGNATKWSDWEDIGGGSSEVDVTDAVNQYGLYALYSQGLMKDNVVYKYQQYSGDLPQFDHNDKIRPFLISKGYDNRGTAITITIKKFNSIITLDVDMCANLSLGGDSNLNHYKFITAVLSTVKVSADMAELTV